MLLFTQPILSCTKAVPLSPGSEDSEDEVETSEAAEDSQGKLEANGTLNSDEDAESCPICLNVFRDQAVGTPETCAHYFCLDCIVEWSRVSWPVPSHWNLAFCPRNQDRVDV